MSGQPDSTPQPAVRECPNGCGRLLPLYYRGLALDRCSTCAGIFLDPDEYEQLHSFPPETLRALDAEVVPMDHKAAAVAGRRDDPRNCPNCRSLMVPFAVHMRTVVTLDRCATCTGLWADDRELEAVIAAYKHEPEVRFNSLLPADMRDELTRDIVDQIAALNPAKRQPQKVGLFHTLAAWVRRSS